MARGIRSLIGGKISEIVKTPQVENLLEVHTTKLKFPPELHLPITGNNKADVLQAITQTNFDSQIIDEISIIPERDKSPTKVAFKLNVNQFVKDVLNPSNYTKLSSAPHTQRHIVVEFSSPNIAKPFHIGHLRSTIIGSVISNLHSFFGHRVTKLNYIGDWGTQFGLLLLGVEMNGVTDEQMQHNPIGNLYRAYVAANEAAKTDENVLAKARTLFTNLENGSSPNIERQWKKYKLYTIQELEKTYDRIGVRFDQYDWESRYSQNQIQMIVNEMFNKSLIFDESDGRRIVKVNGRRVPVIKSDGSTLYLVRDIAALIDRFERYKFDKIFYVVDNAQTDHLTALFKTAAALNSNITENCMQHVKFGRIRGMSTRTGNAVLLSDVLDEANNIMFEKQRQSSTTKIDTNSPEIFTRPLSDILGVSAVIVNDLKQRRQRDYDFDWNKAVQTNGDTGIKLQYTHCRLANLLQNFTDFESVESEIANSTLLTEPEAQELIAHLAKFDQSVWQAKVHLEACILVNYLLALCNITSRALKKLNVKNEPSLQVKKNRILLFATAKAALKNGMEILGLHPLNKM